jgi:hypothetical protein
MPLEGLVRRSRRSRAMTATTAIPCISPVISCYLPVRSLFRMQPAGWGKSSEGPSMLEIRMIGGPGNSEKREISPVFSPVSRDLGPTFQPVIGSEQETRGR